MWAFLGLFTAYRHDVLTKAGSANEDNEWTFGQVLSLTTWIPIGIELLAVYIYDSNKSFQIISNQSLGMERTNTEGIKNGMAYEKTSEEEAIPLKGI
ncbi:hypothetical protein INS49_011958 [Diaporthe citri]|uniref:uncharacterized protein n=1 Tax=Diaporthe citri TaxID=83186 RepID=UPI001C81DD5B|nr:uncharacterized protein INS49_011958 [Diaporthe citri]KAG6360890.1 hypothetical protein INS49_011958 [Diaporthe citri]